MTNVLGTMGAAVSYGISQMAGFVLSAIVFQPVLRVSYSRSLMIILLCTGVAFGAMTLLGWIYPVHFVLQLIAAGLVYITLAHKFSLITSRDILQKEFV
jgi:hypothetical protein